MLWACALGLGAEAQAEDAVSLYQRHRTWFCGKKELSARTRAIGPKGEMVMSSGGDVFTEFVQRVYNKLAELKDTPGALRILPELRTWTDKRRKGAVELEAACRKESDLVQQALVAVEAATEQVPVAALNRWLDLTPKVQAMERCDLQIVINGLSGAARGAGADALARTRRWLLELDGLFARLRDADRWMVLQLDWIARESALAENGLKNDPSFGWRRGWEDLPGAEGMMVRRRDLAALLRIIEDQIIADRLDAVEFGRPESDDASRSLSPTVRPAWRELTGALKDTPGCVSLLQRSLLAPYDLLFVEHQLYKYANPVAEKPESYIQPLAAALRRWNARHEEWDSEAGRLGLLENLHYRQGAVHTAHYAADRFLPQMVDPVAELETDRDEAHTRAQGMVNRILGTMKYGGTASKAECFQKSTADCFRDTEMCATLLANAGHDGIYPLMWRTDGNGHMINAMKLDDRLQTWDCYMPAGHGAGTFPRDFRGYHANHVSLWHRALDTWIEAQILLVREDQLVKQDIPYYGQKGEVVELK